MIKNQAILLNQCVAQVKGNVVSDMDGEKVMLSIKNGKYYNLGKMGGVIWERIEKPIPVTELVTTLISEYEVEQLQCEGQVLSFLEMLLEEGLVEVK
ncbi:metallophosphoesterase [Bacillus wiedmannii]|uniref:Lasso peptide biosynthesis PqqD family chaperone n=1 Tax=Bacillus paramobilis TaxID=2817477 RepID=A0ABZ2VU01_9BACI|nr:MULTISPECIES: lasso peptide biosynthesis PqqD family chaperone [Bacillus cereus group]KXY81410.1 metallophosphoesterase [Bacillus wiedmannii]PEW72063.1 PqqD family protein [Bacillus cereus]MDG1622124.1 lasso peptide biosynthesis PqqD family chaperone [Bacillus mobilis]MDX5839579.1 lasso peptide biosynthesis PqqD family chaperone [Bacillus cereus group sp. BfR-BA-01700]MED4385803.1 lasso peptide biosynthesis PqqD family chaperone [Bacillus mobilis]